MHKLIIKPAALRLAELRQLYHQPMQLLLDKKAHAAIHAACQTVEQIVKQQQVVYGITTGFGYLANKMISVDQLQALQRNLILSHAAGTGELLDDKVVRLIIALKINSLACGYSGVRLELIETLRQLYNAGIYPCIPAKGSVGASGDLAPLAHLSLALLGEGEVRVNGKIKTASTALAEAGIAPITLAPKEGLALINGTQVSTALALAGLFQAEEIFTAALIAGSLSVDAALGSDMPFDPRIHQVRGQKGQIIVATIYSDLLRGSAIREQHRYSDRVQDPYSLRCQPQVMGACLDQLRHAAGILSIEANAVSDNPLIFAQDKAVLSGGNFHAEPVAQAADIIALALAEIGNLAERRIALLVDPHMSKLPAFLVNEAGLNSGFMIAQVTAAALASENKHLAHPASVDTIPTSANQEDHVSMATFAARRLTEMADNTAGIIAIELLAACQGVDFHQPHLTSNALQKAYTLVRASVPFYAQDRYFAPDIVAIKTIIQCGQLKDIISQPLWD